MKADPVALYSALATVAAVTAALQASAAFVLMPDIERLEDRYTAATPESQEMTTTLADARTYATRVAVMTAPLALINLAVIVAWGNVVLGRLDRDWVYITPWLAVALAWCTLVGLPTWLFVRARKIARP